MLKKSPKDNTYIFEGKYDLLYEIHPNSIIDNHIVEHGIMPDSIILNLNKLVNDDAIIFDVGSNVGTYTLPFSRLCPSGQIYSFEPDSKNFVQLTHNINLNKLKNVHSFDYAIQDNSDITEVEFYIKRCLDRDKYINHGISTLEKTPYNNIGNCKVLCTTIDKFMQTHNLKRLDFIKIDVEGSESRVMSGGKKSIKKYLPIIYYEYVINRDEKIGTHNTLSCFKFLKEIGYVQFVLKNNFEFVELKEFDTNLSDCNVLAISSSKEHLLDSSKDIIKLKLLGDINE